METVSTPGIDIAVACDVRLKQYAKEDPNFSVDINPDAVTAVLETFEADAAQLNSLLIVATHPASLDTKAKQKHGVVTLGKFFKPKNNNPATVKVAVRPATLTNLERTTLASTLRDKSFSKETIDSVLPYVETATLSQYDASNLQDTAVHELKHASEYGNHQYKQLNRWASYKSLGRSMLFITGVNGSAYAAVHESIAHNIVNPVVANLGLLATVLAVNIKSYRNDNKRAHEAYLQRPEEVRARAAASEYAASFEPIITVHG